MIRWARCVCPPTVTGARRRSAALKNFRIGTEKIPPEVIRAFAVVKLAAARANAQLGVLDARRAGAIETACHEILDGSLDGNFPLAVWQTGSGTQTNMNVNEVIAHRANELLGGDARASERSRQLLAELERHVPDGHARGRACRARGAGPAGHRPPDGNTRPPERGVPRCGQDRPHASAGRRAAHARAGDQRLERHARPRPRS